MNKLQNLTNRKKAQRRQIRKEEEDLEEISDFIDTIRELNVICVNLQYRHNKIGALDSEIRNGIAYVTIKTPI